MLPKKIPPLDWDAVRRVINTGTMQLLQYIGFWKLGYWTQVFAVVGLILAVTIVMLGPFLLAGMRLARDGERPSIIGLFIMTCSAVSGVTILMLLVRLAQQVLERHPGPLI